MGRWIVDDFGELHRSGSSSFADKLGSGLAGLDIESYAIENIGCIGLAVVRGRVQIRYRPAVVTERAIAGLYYWLADRPDGPVSIAWFDRVWGIERTRSQAAAMSFISYSLDSAKRRDRWGGQRLLSREAGDARRRWAAAAPVFGALLRSQGNDEERRWLLNRTFGGRWTMSEFDRASNDVRILDIGPGYPPLDPVWTANPKGQSFAEFPDAQYGQWISHQHRRVAETGRPCIDDVDAIVFWPRFGDVRTRYWRMILPIDTRGGLCRLLSVTGNGSGIDLRPKHVERAGEIVDQLVGAHPN